MDHVPSYGDVHGEAVTSSRRDDDSDPAAADDAQPRKLCRSVSQLGRFLGEQAEALGAAILPETDAQKLLVADGRVHGIRTATRASAASGRPLGSLRTRLGHRRARDRAGRGTQGHLTGAAIDRFGSPASSRSLGAGRQGGVEGERPLGHIVHTMGWPPRTARGTASSAAPSSIRWATTWSRSASSPGSSNATSSSRSRRAPGAEDPPARAQDPRGRRARRLGREDDHGRAIPRAALPLPTPPGSCSRAKAPAWSTCRP